MKNRTYGLLTVGLWVIILATGALGEEMKEIRKSVVKIFNSSSPPNIFRPWEVTAPQEVSGSGVIIEGGRILTNAHVVANSQQLYVQPYEWSEKLDAEVEFISEECDLATLVLDDPDAIKELKPVPLADALPGIKDKVNVLGYPEGGDTLSITEGVVSRIEYGNYYHNNAALIIQVDAAINPGNSGGPAIVDEKITGIVFSKLSESDNIGYLIPAEVIKHFLDDWQKDNKYDGFPKVEVVAATLENPAARKFLKLEREETGVVIHRVNRPEIEDMIKPWDVVTACDGVDIDNLGLVSIADGVRVSWGYLISHKPAGSTVKFDLVRDGEPMSVELSTVTKRNTVIQKLQGDRPTYFIYGGLVFEPVTDELVMASSRFFGVLALRGSMVTRYTRAYREDPERELVATVSPILPHKLTKGYEVTPLSVVTHVNDVEVVNLRQMIEVIKENLDEEFIVFRFENDWEEKIVLQPKKVEKYMPEILRNNNIPAACSDDLKDIWSE